MQAPVSEEKLSRSERRMRSIEAALADGKPRTAEKIALEVVLDRRHCGTYLKAMHKAGRVYIKQWQRAAAPMYLVGSEKDAPEPRVRTGKQKQRAYFKRAIQDPEKHMHMCAQRKARHVKKPPKQASTWLQPLLTKGK